MKKLVLSIIFLLGFSTTAYATGSVGFTISNAKVLSGVSDDIDNNGTTDTTRNLSNDVTFASIFVEKALNDNMSVGLDFIPLINVSSGDRKFGMPSPVSPLKICS